MTAVEDSVRSDPPEEAWAPAAPEGLYVHVPFCVSVCPYCDFVVYGGSDARGPRNRLAPLVEALHRELELRVASLPDGAARTPLTSVYLGGGTPSLLAPATVAGLLEDVDARLGLGTGTEVTLEVNPGADDRGDLAGFRAAGVTRISIGAQSLDDRLLSRLGRRHRASDVGEAIRAARGAGVGSVSLDLLTDVPGQSVGDWRRTLEAALGLEPDHLSVYALALDDPDAEGLTGPTGDHLPVRRGARAWRERARTEQSPDRAADMDALADELTARAGMRRYEIANLARPGHESRHNLLYWRRRPYLAIGPGAHASDGGLVRSWNAASLVGYLDALRPTDDRPPRLPPGGRERVDVATAEAERAILALRLTEGLDTATAARPAIADGLTWAVRNRLADRSDGRVRLTPRGRALSNEVFMRLLPSVSPEPPVAARAGSASAL
jgi:putative oxygen-independent coproporphyrinogen III oxidase